jgi:1-acyl-sn-glycerol-3-phosphate acyltransferase
VITLIVYWAATYITWYLLLPLYTKVQVRGLENVPEGGPLIVASNHLNDADPGFLCGGIRRRLVYMTKVELFQVPVLSQFLTAFGAFPVRRNEADLAALRRASETLKQGLALVIFPEGTRGRAEAQLREAWPGAALMALRNDAPVLPVALTGSEHLALPGMFLRPFRRYRVTMTIGKPFHLPKPERVNAESVKAGTQAIMEQIALLLPEQNRGFYAEAVASKQPAGTQA